MREAEITVNGERLTTAQPMTVRVALESFAMRLAAEGLGDDEHGHAMTQAYAARLAEIRVALYKGLKDA